MTQLKVDTITDAAGTAAPDLEDGLTVNGAALSTVNTAEYYSSGTEPSSPKDGAIWWDTGNDKVMIYVNDAWYEVELGAAASAVWYGDRAVFGFGTSNVYDYVNIASAGNATDFGDPLSGKTGYYSYAMSNGTYGVWAGHAYDDVTMQYITFSTTGNAADFGDLAVAQAWAAATGDGTYGVIGMGRNSSYSNVNTVQRVSLETTGNAADFDDLTVATRFGGAACSNGVRGIFAGGGNQNTIDYILIATSGSGADFGDLSVSTNYAEAAESTTRAVLSLNNAGGSSNNNTLVYITMDTTGNSTDFGDLTVGRQLNAGATNATKGIWGGGGDSPYSNVIDQVTIDTTGNATDFGDLTVARRFFAATSGAAS